MTQHWKIIMLTRLDMDIECLFRELSIKRSLWMLRLVQLRFLDLGHLNNAVVNIGQVARTL